MPLHMEYGQSCHRMEDGSEKPVMFASRSLSPAEKKYPQFEKEGLPIIFGVKKFHGYVFGRKLTIFSDHRPLQHLFSKHRPVSPLASASIQRWALTLSTYEYTMSYKPGKQDADAYIESTATFRNAFRSSPTSRDCLDDWNITGISSECCVCSSMDWPRPYTVKSQNFSSVRLAKSTRWRHASLHLKEKWSLSTGWMCVVGKSCYFSSGWAFYSPGRATWWSPRNH